MPCYYTIHVDENVVAKKYFGRVTTACVLRLIDTFQADPNYRNDMMELDDLRDLEDLDMSTKDISEIAIMLTGFSDRKQKSTRKSVLAPHGAARAAAFGFKSLVEANDAFEVGIFSTLTDAVGFLDLNDADRFQIAVYEDFKVH